MTDAEMIRAYAAGCRARVPEFTARHFGWRGTLRLHRAALGLDLLRAPFNVMLVAPTLALRLLAWAAHLANRPRAAAWLRTKSLFVETGLARHIADLVLREVLRIDAAETPLPEGRHSRARRLIAEYVDARHAVAEFATASLVMLFGLIALHALTPSAITLGPLLAQQFTLREAVEGFWLGPWAGSFWYALFPPDVGLGRVVAITAMAMGCFALLATFMGLLVDPLLQMAGLHRRRLEHLVGTLERIMLGEADATLGLPDLYVARLTDIADVIILAVRYTR
jgi:hypothetical protein